jgi:hypothetical protein
MNNNTIEVKLEKLINSNAYKTVETLLGKELPLDAAIEVIRLYRALSRAHEHYGSQRLALIEKYGVKDNDGKLIVDSNGAVDIQADKLEQFHSEDSKLLEEVVLIPGLNINKFSSLTVIPREIESIEFLFL